MAKAKTQAPRGILLDEQEKICRVFRGGKKQVRIDGRLFSIRKISHRVKVMTKANPEGTMVLEHWLVVAPVKGDGPVANIAYPHRTANSRADLL